MLMEEKRELLEVRGRLPEVREGLWAVVGVVFLSFEVAGGWRC